MVAGRRRWAAFDQGSEVDGDVGEAFEDDVLEGSGDVAGPPSGGAFVRWRHPDCRMSDSCAAAEDSSLVGAADIREVPSRGAMCPRIFIDCNKKRL